MDLHVIMLKFWIGFSEEVTVLDDEHNLFE